MDRTFDKKMLRLLKHGDCAAVEQWFEGYCDPLYTFVYYRVGRDGEIAGDVVQETFVRAMRQIDKFEPKRGTMFAWLTYISRNCIKKALREKGRASAVGQLWAQIDSELLHAYRCIATEPLPEEVVERQETAELVQMTLANIPANYKEMLTEYYYRLRPLREIAAANSVSEGAIKAMLYRARRAFKAAFLKLADSFNAAAGPEGGSDG